MILCQNDRDLLELWAVHGIPDDQSTRDWALTQVIPKLWARVQELEATIASIIDGTP